MNKNNELLKKSKNGIFKTVFSRAGLIILFLLIQILFMFSFFSSFFPQFVGGYTILSIIMVLYIVNIDMDSQAKITWMVLIVTLPVFGTLFFWFTKLEIGHRFLKSRIRKTIDETKGILKSKNPDELDDELASLAKYLNRSGNFPVYTNCRVTYFPLGENKFERMLVELEKAKDFIFMEYFIIDEGIMWHKILEILKRKVKEGVDVRVMYDGTCAFTTLPYNYPKRLKKAGIKAKMFSPLTPFVSTHYNYRDHRKILVIDGIVAFNGGVNIGDEYINAYEKHGHWKDTAVLIEGEAVKSFTLMFLQMWNILEKNVDYEKFINMPGLNFEEFDGFVIPYGDAPLDYDKVGQKVYMDILNRADNYVHIITPYLILDSNLCDAIKFASERGVDVKIILPGIPDKVTPYALAKTYYKTLMTSGVKIYEYTSGFTHAKVFVSDDIKAVVGTINLDYRSLYHHFECATYLYKNKCIVDIENDFEDTLAKCKLITYDDLKNEKLWLKILGFIMKILGPLM